MTNRLFLALDLPSATIDYLENLKDEIYGTPNNVNWEVREKLHITSKFLGDVGDYLTELIIDRFDNLNLQSVSCEFSEFNFFKKNNEIKVLFAGIKTNDQLIKIQNLVENECQLLGFEKENRFFKPHITLLRLKGNENFDILEKFKNFKINHNFTINTFSLLKSELKPSGSVYTNLKCFKML